MKSATSSFILIAFVTLSGFGVLTMTGMDGHHHEPGCPFMRGEQAICNMTVLDHITAWQNTFTAIVPILFVYLQFVAIVLLVWKYHSPPDFFVRRLLSRCTEEHASVPFYQQLFSSGILNPKAP